MDFVTTRETTPNELAGKYTLSSGYALAVIEHNGWIGWEPETPVPAGIAFNLPDNWLLPGVKTGATAITSNVPGVSTYGRTSSSPLPTSVTESKIFGTPTTLIIGLGLIGIVLLAK
jgi:hypothetical protein